MVYYKCNNQNCGLKFTNLVQVGKENSVTNVCPHCFNDNWVKLEPQSPKFICKCGHQFINPIIIGEENIEVCPMCKTEEFSLINILNENLINRTEKNEEYIFGIDKTDSDDGEPKNLKSFDHRYRVSISFFILDNTKEGAIEQAKEIVAMNNYEYDNQCTLNGIDLIDFAQKESIKIL